MKFAIDVSTENPHRPSGATGYYVNIARELSRIAGSDEIILIRGRQQESTFKEFEAAIGSIVLPYSNEHPLLRVAGQQFLLPVLLRRHKIDLLNTGNVGPVFPMTPVVATVKTMHAFTAPESLPMAKRLFRKRIGGRTATRAKLVISNSESNTEDLIRYFGIDPSRIRVVHEALDHNLFKPESIDDGTDALLNAIGVDGRYVVFVSSLWRYKNLDVLIRAASEWKNSQPELNVVVAGFHADPEYAADIKRLVTEYGLAERIHFVGGQSQETVAALYRRAVALVYPSRNETFGLPLLEAMACECPVISTRAGSLGEIGGDAIDSFDPDDHESLASIVQSHYLDPAKTETQKRLGLERAAKFNWSETAAKTLEIFREAIGT